MRRRARRRGRLWTGLGTEQRGGVVGGGLGAGGRVGALGVAVAIALVGCLR